LTRLGFVAARRSEQSGGLPKLSEDARAPYGGRQAEALRPFLGRWVALAGPCDVLIAADTPEEVLAWLSQHGREAKSGMLRVPTSAQETEGLAPL
jgi:hypothetical protein